MESNGDREDGGNSLALAAGAAGIAVVIALLIWLTWPAGIPFGDVEGEVTLDGQPLPDVEVVFMPDPAAGGNGPASTATTDASGKYRLGTMKGRVGAAVGVHRVVLMEARPDPAVKPPGWDRLPPRVAPLYSQVTSTPFVNVEVRRGKQTLDFKLTANPGQARK